MNLSSPLEEVIVTRSGNAWVLGNRVEAIFLDPDEKQAPLFVDTQAFLKQRYSHDGWTVVDNRARLPRRVKAAIAAFRARTPGPRFPYSIDPGTP
jgi:hypothetical protein